MSQFARERNRKRLGLMVLLVVLLGWAVIARLAIRRAEAPEFPEMVRGFLVSWGLDTDGMELSTSAEEIEVRVRLLRSRISEERVRAAEWLAARGIRRAAPAIAAAMGDPDTLRPCQLAKSLGELGDARYVPLLTEAATQTGNADLRVCATIALGDLASPAALPALMDAYQRELVTTTALSSIGLIGDPSALPFLRSVAASPRNDFERKAALRAIQRIEILEVDDPIPLLASLLREGIDTRLDEWAVRALAFSGDPRAVEILEDARLDLPEGRRRDAALLAAATSRGPASSSADADEDSGPDREPPRRRSPRRPSPRSQ